MLANLQAAVFGMPPEGPLQAPFVASPAVSYQHHPPLSPNPPAPLQQQQPPPPQVLPQQQLWQHRRSQQSAADGDVGVPFDRTASVGDADLLECAALGGSLGSAAAVLPNGGAHGGSHYAAGGAAGQLGQPGQHAQQAQRQPSMLQTAGSLQRPADAQVVDPCTLGAEDAQTRSLSTSPAEGSGPWQQAHSAQEASSHPAAAAAAAALPHAGSVPHPAGLRQQPPAPHWGDSYGFAERRGAAHEAHSGALPALSIIQGQQGQAGHAAAAAPLHSHARSVQVIMGSPYLSSADTSCCPKIGSSQLC
jgi:hypothetical protein